VQDRGMARTPKIAASGLWLALLLACAPGHAERAPLHRAAVTLRVLLEKGFDRNSLAQATSQLHAAYDGVKSTLPGNARKTCERAASASDSLGRIVTVISAGDMQRLKAMRPDLEAVGFIETPGDWDALNGRLSYLQPGGDVGGDDNDLMGDLHPWLSQTLANDVLAAAKSGVLAAVRQCDQATDPA
jgi:hypothetical protein